MNRFHHMLYHMGRRGHAVRIGKGEGVRWKLAPERRTYWMQTSNNALVSWALEPDHKTVKVTFATSPPTVFQIDVVEVERLLENLGKLRSLMQPAIPSDHAIGQKVAAVPNPRWVAEPDVMQGDSLLHIRDPRYGWLHYVLPRSEARKLGSTLQVQADAPAPETYSGKPN